MLWSILNRVAPVDTFLEAAQKGNIVVLEQCLQSEVLNWRDGYNAANNKHHHDAAMLIGIRAGEHDCKVYEMNKAIRRNKWDMVLKQLSVDKNPNLNRAILPTACRFGKAEYIQQILNGMDHIPVGHEPIDIAVHSNTSEVVKVLVDHVRNIHGCPLYLEKFRSYTNLSPELKIALFQESQPNQFDVIEQKLDRLLEYFDRLNIQTKSNVS
jgi:hypothetical protein